MMVISGKLLRVVGITLGFVLLFLGSISQKSSYDWNKILSIAETYFVDPSVENAIQFLNCLPKSPVDIAQEGGDFIKASYFISARTPIFHDRAIKSDRNVVKIVVRLYAISDSSFTEALNDIMGDLIVADPKLFLEELIFYPGSPNMHESLFEHIGRGYIVCNGARIYKDSYTGVAQTIREYGHRIKALETISDEDLLELRNECLQAIRNEQTKLAGILEYLKQDVEETETPIKGDALDVLLSSTSVSERRSAFMDILKNPGPSIDRILLGIDIWQKTKEQGIEALNKLIYLGAIVKKDEFLEPLLNMAMDPEYSGYECIYTCPAIFALAVYVVSKKWTPPEASFLMKDQYLRDIDSLVRQVSLIRKHSGIYFGRPEDQELLAKMEEMSEEQLIKQASPYNQDKNTRWLAAEVLSCTVTDDKNLSDLYWLALEEAHDAIDAYRTSIYVAVLRAEKARLEKIRRY
jgi:hypothetical protein